LCTQLTRDLFAIAKFLYLYSLYYSVTGLLYVISPHFTVQVVVCVPLNSYQPICTTSYFTDAICLPPTTEEVHAIAGVCLSVSKITQKRVDGFGLNVACRRMSGHGGTD